MCGLRTDCGKDRGEEPAEAEMTGLRCVGEERMMRPGQGVSGNRCVCECVNTCGCVFVSEYVCLCV